MILCSTLSYLASAQIITDRPDQTESPITVPYKSLQIETGSQLMYQTSGDLTTRELLIPTTLLRLGVASGFELRLLTQYQSVRAFDKTTNSIPDIEIGAKVWLAGGTESKTNIGLISHLAVPSSNTSTSEDGYGISLILSVDHELGNGLSFAYNLGYNSKAAVDGALTYTAALGWGLTDKLNVYVEPYGTYNGLEGLVVNADAGFAYLINDRLQYDFSFGIGISNRMNYLSTGVSWLIQ